MMMIQKRAISINLGDDMTDRWIIMSLDRTMPVKLTNIDLNGLYSLAQLRKEFPAYRESWYSETLVKFSGDFFSAMFQQITDW